MKTVSKAIMNNFMYYLERNRFNTVKIATIQKLGLCRKQFERTGVPLRRGKDWFYIIDDGRMTYYYCHK